MTATDRDVAARAPLLSPWAWPTLGSLLLVGWSSAFLGVRYASDVAPVSLILFWRTLLSGLLLLPFALWLGPRPSGRAIAEQAVYGFVSMFLYMASAAWAIEQRVPTGLVALISDLVPLIIALLSAPILGLGLSRRQWLGTAISIVGVLIVSAHSLSLGSAPLWAYLLPMVGMSLFAAMSVLQKRFGATRMPLHQSLTIQCLSATIFFAMWAWFDDGLIPPADLRFGIGVLWLVFIATYLCFGVYYLSLRLFPPAKVSSVVYLSPPFTMLWAWIGFGEPFSVTMVAGLAVTMVGVWLTSIGR